MGQDLFGGFTKQMQAGSEVAEGDSQPDNRRQLQADNQPGDGVTTGQPTTIASGEAPDPNALFKELNGDSPSKGIKVCLQGSAYTGPSLADTIGFTEDKFQTVVDQMANLDSITDQIDVSFLDTVFATAKTELGNFKERAKGYSNDLGTKFQEDAKNSCDQCNKFGTTFAHFTSFDNENLQKFGES